MSKSFAKVVPAGHIHIKNNVMEKGNLTGISESTDLWAKDLNLPRTGEYTLFAGCGYQQMKYVEGMMGALKGAGKVGIGVGKAVGISKVFNKVGIDLTSMTAKATASKDDPYTPVLISAVNILRKLGIEPAYLHEDEPCCGSPMHYAGFEKDYAANARENYRRFTAAGVKKMIGIIPACTSTLRSGYPEHIDGFDIEVFHILEIISRIMQAKKIFAQVKERIKVVYHDPCQLSRYLNITAEPREILDRIDGVERVEPDEEEKGRWSTCCGGGNMEATHPELSERMGVRRYEALAQTGASLIVTNCPACEMQLRHMAKKAKSQLEVVDILSLLDTALD